MYEPGPIRQNIERDGHVFSWRGLINLGALALIIAAILTLLAGYPIIYHFTRGDPSTLGAFNLGGINASGQVPDLQGRFSPIDPDTPQDAYTRTSPIDSSQKWELVFSDEFNVDNRTFYPGDDPYWEAVDLHYWETNNLEWYDPASVTTQGGSLMITLMEKETHNLNYQGAMITSWNKFCFTGGYVEVKAQLPGVSNIEGLWPAVWMMGNLGRAGYGATLDGMWPYTYDACDVGTVANQSINGNPPAALVNGDPGKGGVLSYLPGQKLSRCTCGGEDHPGPKHSDNTFVGRAAPEIDVFEAQITTGGPGAFAGVLTGQVSQSAQWAPFDAGYWWQNTSSNEIIYNPEITIQNPFVGSATQEATSVVTNTNTQCYEYPDPNFVPAAVSGAQLPAQVPGGPPAGAGCFAVYGVEYKPGFDDAYISWMANEQLAWTLNVAGMGPNSETQISQRPVPQEPMYLIANLGMSYNFGPIDLTHIPFPVHLRIDYIRVYQPSNAVNIGCDPSDFPTADYINEHMEAYTNPNLTTWTGDYGQPWPKNSFLKQC
ncbi:glycoside hydrolase family 16 protein [Phanerochaete carnosa HHB-10118-sp]|uniref:Glycoside hydrolase family 16 protein n=1 Tax=Phanerochaete carnosa (strain HHB-10118-sp) TaxID=650164 RepID=K5WIU8_PHACS|nr:glycoside hydrolase family 16 protein [Phanerochaete carnosa HHB-10118-sp]EKM59285.1 glycoside hydrolase family 16 protein [Phanerochaete carnosa HHB-10118-sp]